MTTAQNHQLNDFVGCAGCGDLLDPADAISSNGRSLCTDCFDEDILLVLDDILTERHLQQDKWGDQQHHPLYWLGILVEEVGEVTKALIEKSSLQDIRTELIQTAAVAVQIVENIDHQIQTNVDL